MLEKISKIDDNIFNIPQIGPSHLPLVVVMLLGFFILESIFLFNQFKNFFFTLNETIKA